jgi:hypothetical protein
MATMTKKGARSVTRTLDRIATLFQQEFKTLGVPEKYAMDFAYRCDLMSGEVEKKAGVTKEALDELDVVKEPGFDPEVIGEEVKGPEVSDPDEPYMKDHFTQQVNRELRERQEAGDLGAAPVLEIQAPQPGKQATFEQIGRVEAHARLSKAASDLQSAAVRLASAGHKTLAKAVSKFASSLMEAQVGLISGGANATQVTRLLQAAGHLLPGLTKVEADKTAAMVALALKVAGKKAEDDPDEEPDEDEGKKGGKKADLPPEFLQQQKGKGDDKDDKKDEGKSDEKKDDKKPDFLKDDKKDEGKKASHGFNLFQ